jgi:hypothetical protein
MTRAYGQPICHLLQITWLGQLHRVVHFSLLPRRRFKAQLHCTYRHSIAWESRTAM